MLTISDNDAGTVSVLEDGAEVWPVTYDPDNRESQKRAHSEARGFIYGVMWRRADARAALNVNAAGVPVFEGRAA